MAEPTPHDPERCLTCRGRVAWTPERRVEEEIASLSHGRRVLDLPDAPWVHVRDDAA